MIAPDDRLLRKSIKHHEGFRLKVYDDDHGNDLERGDKLVGYATIGYGRNLHVGVSQLEAEFLLKNDISRAYMDAEKFEWFSMLNSTRQRVVVEMVFNLGPTRFRGFVNTIAALDAGLYDAAANEMLSSLWADQVGQRATTLASQMRTGE